MPKISVIDTSGNKKETITVSGKIFAAKVSPRLMNQAIRVYLANQRIVSAQTKSRGEIKVSKRKIYRQKGTGRARHGSRNAPIFVGGGKAHGPTGKQNYKLKIAKKMKRLSLFSALTSRFQDNDIIVVTGLGKIRPKTKNMVKFLKKVKQENKKIILILAEPVINLARASTNLSGLNIVIAQNLNTYQVLNAATLIFTKKAIKSLDKLWP